MRETAGEKDDPLCNALLFPHVPKLTSRRYTFHILALAPIYQIHAAPGDLLQEQRPFGVKSLFI